jgi:hypothetical protein
LDLQDGESCFYIKISPWPPCRLPAGEGRKIRIIQEGCSAALLQRISRISGVFYLFGIPPRLSGASIFDWKSGRLQTICLKRRSKIGCVAAGGKNKKLKIAHAGTDFVFAERAVHSSSGGVAHCSRPGRTFRKRPISHHPLHGRGMDGRNSVTGKT